MHPPKDDMGLGSRAFSIQLQLISGDICAINNNESNVQVDESGTSECGPRLINEPWSRKGIDEGVSRGSFEANKGI